MEPSQLNSSRFAVIYKRIKQLALATSSSWVESAVFLEHRSLRSMNSLGKMHSTIRLCCVPGRSNIEGNKEANVTF